MSQETRLVLGPLLYNWSAEKRLAFYRQVAEDAPVDDVILGEVVCSKRTPFVTEATAEAAAILEAAGKRVIHAALALPVQPRERDSLRDICAMAGDGALVEANEAGALFHLRGKPHHVGPFFNVYNAGTLRVLINDGAKVVCLPWELDAESIGHLSATAAGLGAETEVQVFGHVPLAISARCYHARAHGLSKDGCQYVCGLDDEGMEVDTLDGESFLRVNGTQTMSHTVQLLVDEVAGLREAGVSRLRLSPEPVDMIAVARAYRDLLDGACDAEAAMARLREVLGSRTLSNGFLHASEGAAWVA